jgi:hypothetical protein
MKEKYRDRALRALNQKKNQVLKRRLCGDFGAIKSKTPVSGRALAKAARLKTGVLTTCSDE